MAADDPNETPGEAHTPPVPADCDQIHEPLTLTDDQGDVILSGMMPVDGQLPLGRRIEPSAPRGRGRPKGSKNKTTDRLHKYLLQRGMMHPLEFLSRAYTMDKHVLALELSERDENGELTDDGRVSAAEAFRLQIAAAKEALPYYASKLPQPVEGGGQMPTIMIMGPMPEGVTPETVEGWVIERTDDTEESK